MYLCDYGSIHPSNWGRLFIQDESEISEYIKEHAPKANVIGEFRLCEPWEHNPRTSSGHVDVNSVYYDPRPMFSFKLVAMFEVTGFLKNRIESLTGRKVYNYS